MKAVHLAAGQGTRLRPLTDDKPKPLVELAGMSLLERNIETFGAVGVTDQTVVTGYKAERIESLGYDTVRNRKYDTTEMVYSLFSAVDVFPDGEDLIVSYGDILYAESVVEALIDSDSPLSIVVDRDWRELWSQRFDDPLDDAETLHINGDRVVEIGSAPANYDDIDGQYIGLIKIRADHIEQFIDAYRTLDTETIHMTSFIEQLINDDWQVEPVEIDAGWLEVDTVADLELYQKLLESDTPPNHVSFIQ